MENSMMRIMCPIVRKQNSDWLCTGKSNYLTAFNAIMAHIIVWNVIVYNILKQSVLTYLILSHMILNIYCNTIVTPLQHCFKVSEMICSTVSISWCFFQLVLWSASNQRPEIAGFGAWMKSVWIGSWGCLAATREGICFRRDAGGG